MHSKPVNDYPRAVIEQLTSVIPFFKQVRQQDAWQFELLLKYSQVLSFESGETVLERGACDSWLCFLLKGQLIVLAGEASHAVNYITPGEVFGDLAMLLKQERSATVVADHNSREILVFATDFSVFGDLEDVRTINLPTKLTYYRNLIHSLRWKLEVYRTKYPHYSLANGHRSVKLYRGEKETMDELRALDQQARQLGRLLTQWNIEFGRLTVTDGEALGGDFLAEVSI